MTCAAIYVRVSTSRQADHDLSMPDQIAQCRAYCEGNPEWAISIALVESGLPMAAVLDAPALGAGWHAMRGGGVSLDDATGAFRGRRGRRNKAWRPEAGA